MGSTQEANNIHDQSRERRSPENFHPPRIPMNAEGRNLNFANMSQVEEENLELSKGLAGRRKQKLQIAKEEPVKPSIAQARQKVKIDR